MIDTRFETTIDLRGEIENYRQVALIKYYKILLELDPRRDRLTMLAVIRCIDKLERHSQERKRSRNDKKKMLAEGTLAWHYQKRNQLFRKAGIYDIESTQFLVLRYTRGTGRARTIRSLPSGSPQKANRNTRGRRKRIRATGLRSRSR